MSHGTQMQQFATIPATWSFMSILTLRNSFLLEPEVDWQGISFWVVIQWRHKQLFPMVLSSQNTRYLDMLFLMQQKLKLQHSFITLRFQDQSFTFLRNLDIYNHLRCWKQTTPPPIPLSTRPCGIKGPSHRIRYWWLKEKTIKSKFDIFWYKGVHNWVDYFTKHFASIIHKVLRPGYIHPKNLILDTICTSLPNSLSARVCWSYPIPCMDGQVSDMLMYLEMDSFLPSIILVIIY